MVEPTNELIFRTLQQVQDTLAEHTRSHQDHTRRLEKLERTVEDLRVTTATSLGFAMHSNMRHESADERLEEVVRRVGSLEDLKRRVEDLERTR